MFELCGERMLKTQTLSKDKLWELMGGMSKAHMDPQECIRHFKEGSMDEKILARCNVNEEDPEHKGSQCKTNDKPLEAHSYEKAVAHFNHYYDTHNNTDSGRLRGKMFDVKYNKKGKDLLYFGEPCSAKYMEEDGPKKYDLWYVDAFPTGDPRNG